MINGAVMLKKSLVMLNAVKHLVRKGNETCLTVETMLLQEDSPA